MYLSTIIISLLGSIALAQSSTTATTATQCTNVVTQHAPFGCTITQAAATTTESIDCKGCVLSTTLIANGFFGHGPVCFNGRKTVADAKVTATVQACSA